MFWQDLKQVIHAQKQSSLSELKQFYKEWAKTPPQQRERLIQSTPHTGTGIFKLFSP